MKRIIVALLLVAITAGVAQAQVGVYRSGGAIKKEKKGTLGISNSIMFNYAWTFVGKTSNLGLTYARSYNIGGFYVSMLSGLEWNAAKTWWNGIDLLTNERSHPRISFTVGGMLNLKIPLYLYMGAGYAYRGLNYKTENENWVKYVDPDYNLGSCFVYDIGLMGSIKGLTLQAGYSILASKGKPAGELKVGIGYTFK